MPHRIVTIAAAEGLHARPAGTFARAAAAAGVPVTLGRPGAVPVDGASLLMVMGLGLRRGEPVELGVEGDGTGPVLDRLAALLATDLDAAP